MHWSSGTGSQHAPDWYICASSVAIFCAMMLCFEKNATWIWASVFSLCASVWGLWLQPAVFDRCRLALWMLIFDAVRNLAVIEAHANRRWVFATVSNAFALAR